MSLVAQPVAVSVPATSANLGPGYDCLGLALELRDDYRVEVGDWSGVEVEIIGEGVNSIARDETNLVVRSMFHGLRALGHEAPAGVSLRCHNVIPHGRGLGSSSAAIVGGLGLARELVPEGHELLSDLELVALATELEGHPDNVAPAVLGGFTMGWMDDGVGRAARLDPTVQVGAVVAVPEFELSTDTARSLIPTMVAMTDAVANISRAAMLCHALTRDPQLLFPATEDRLHQLARSAAYPETFSLVMALRQVGLAAVVSGAGPTVLVLTAEDVADIAAQVRTAAGTAWRVQSLEFATAGVLALSL